MKKMWVLGLMIFLLIGILGCEKEQTVVIGSEPAQPVDTGTTDAVTANTSTTPTTPAVTTPKIDLELESVTWSTIYPELSQPIELKIKVKNAGTEPVDEFDYNVRIVKDGTEWKDETKTYTQTLYPGNKTKIELTYTFTSEGKYSAEVYLDKDNKLGDNKFNNVKISIDATAVKATSTAPPGSSDDEEEDSGSCVDTDGGRDESSKGECNDGVTLGIGDYCSSDATAVVEWYCGDDDRCHTEEITCDYSCEDGKCS